MGKDEEVMSAQVGQRHMREGGVCVLLSPEVLLASSCSALRQHHLSGAHMHGHCVRIDGVGDLLLLLLSQVNVSIGIITMFTCKC